MELFARGDKCFASNNGGTLWKARKRLCFCSHCCSVCLFLVAVAKVLSTCMILSLSPHLKQNPQIGNLMNRFFCLPMLLFRLSFKRLIWIWLAKAAMRLFWKILRDGKLLYRQMKMAYTLEMRLITLSFFKALLETLLK